MYNEDIIESIRNGESRPTYLRILSAIATEALSLEAPIGQKAFRKRLREIAPGAPSTVSQTLQQVFKAGLLTGTLVTIKPMTDEQFEAWRELISAGTKTMANHLNELLKSDFVDQDTRKIIETELDAQFGWE